jgi:hypothetical protein
MAASMTHAGRSFAPGGAVAAGSFFQESVKLFADRCVLAPIIMKFTFLTPALVAVLGLALASVPVTLQAQTATNATAPAAPSTATKTKEKSQYTPYKGSISAMDTTSVTVTTDKGDVKLALDPTTIIQVNKKKAAATDFAVGDKVTGSYTTGADGTLTAHSLRKKAAATK